MVRWQPGLRDRNQNHRSLAARNQTCGCNCAILCRAASLVIRAASSTLLEYFLTFRLEKVNIRRMNQSADYITEDKKRDLLAELEDLKGPKRREILASLEYAKSLGDLSEN